jgi:hypothetical protein
MWNHRYQADWQHLGTRGLSQGHLDARNSQRPNVCLQRRQGKTRTEGGSGYTFPSYPLAASSLIITSGAIQYGDPTKVWHFVIVSVSCPVAPKSASFTAPFLLSRMFAPEESFNNSDII